MESYPAQLSRNSSDEEFGVPTLDRWFWRESALRLLVLATPQSPTAESPDIPATAAEWLSLDGDGRAVEARLIEPLLMRHYLSQTSSDAYDSSDFLLHSLGRETWDEYTEALPWTRHEVRFYDQAVKSVYPLWLRSEQEADSPEERAARALGFRAIRGEIEVDGILKSRTVSVGELIDRWWDWRRGTGDFAGGDRAERAYDAVRLFGVWALEASRQESVQES